MPKTARRSLLVALTLAAVILGGACILPSIESQSGIPTGNTLTVFGSSPLTLDPAISQEADSHTYILQIFSGLVTLDQNMAVVPDIAQSWTVETTEQGTAYTFHLRSGVRFHDGREVTAADFKYSLERACSPDTGSPTAPTYLNDIVGVQEVLDGQTETISGVEAVDDATLRITIDQPKAYFLAKMTYPVAFVVDKANVESDEDWWHQPNGTGPFSLAQWTPDELLLLERNNLYYGDVASVSYVAFVLAGAPMQMYENGDVDVVGVSLWDLERAMDEDNPLHAQLMMFPELSLTYFGFNAQEPPFDDPRVRQAFCLAVDKDRVVSQVLKDSVTAAGGILPRGMPGFNTDLDPLNYDLARAKALLTECGYGPGRSLPTITFNVPGFGGYVPTSMTAVLYQWSQNLSDFGVEIEIRQIDSDAYFYRLDEEKDDVFFYGWVADYADPQDFLEILFGTDSANNVGHYSSLEADALLAQAAVEPDDEQRMALYQQVEQIMVSEAACLPLWFGQNYILVKPRVEGYALSPLGIPLLTKVSLTF
jgi:oligopeptide transport system substrate-binding protein